MYLIGFSEGFSPRDRGQYPEFRQKPLFAYVYVHSHTKVDKVTPERALGATGAYTKRDFMRRNIFLRDCLRIIALWPLTTVIWSVSFIRGVNVQSLGKIRKSSQCGEFSGMKLFQARLLCSQSGRQLFSGVFLCCFNRNCAGSKGKLQR